MTDSSSGRNAPYLLFSLLLSLATLTALAIASVEDLDPEIRQVLQYADWLVCTLFFVDFLFQFARAEQRLQYMLRYASWCATQASERRAATGKRPRRVHRPHRQYALAVPEPRGAGTIAPRRGALRVRTGGRQPTRPESGVEPVPRRRAFGR